MTIWPLASYCCTMGTPPAACTGCGACWAGGAAEAPPLLAMCRCTWLGSAAPEEEEVAAALLLLELELLV